MFAQNRYDGQMAYGRKCELCRQTASEARRAKRAASKKPPSRADLRWRRAERLCNAARVRAWRKGIMFTLQVDWVFVRLEIGVCEVTGIPFDFAQPGRGARYGFTPSIDRKDSGRGYTEDNCQVVVWIYNRAKGEGSHDDVLRMAQEVMNRATTPLTSTPTIVPDQRTNWECQRYARKVLSGPDIPTYG